MKLNDYLASPRFVAIDRIEGIAYVTIKRTDNDLYRYRILKIENDTEIIDDYDEYHYMVTRCDTKAQAEAEIERIRKEIRDERIRKERAKMLQSKPIYNGTWSNMKAINEAYLESIGVI